MGMTRIPVEWIDRYFAGESGPEEVARVKAWLAEDARHRVFADALLAAGRGDAEMPEAAGAAATWRRVARRMAPGAAHDADIGIAIGPAPAVGRGRFRKFAPRRVSSRWGAVGLAGVAVCALVLVALVWRLPTRATPAVARTYATSAGQRATVLLPDGSNIILAPQTTLSVRFSANERSLVLTGRAYFDVAQVQGAPFVVRAGGVATRVLGTVFEIQHYPGDANVDVGVVRGKVAAGVSRRAPRVLTAGMTGRFGDSTDTVAAHRAVDVAWAHGDLVFRDTPLPDALATLSRWYGIEFRVADSAMTRWHVTGTFAGDSRSEALTTLRAALGVSFTFSGTPGQIPIVTLVHQRHSTTAEREELDPRRRPDFTDPSREVGR